MSAEINPFRFFKFVSMEFEQLPQEIPSTKKVSFFIVGSSLEETDCLFEERDSGFDDSAVSFSPIEERFDVKNNMTRNLVKIALFFIFDSMIVNNYFIV